MSLEAWFTTLRQGTPQQLVEAAEALGHHGDVKAVGQLVQGLRATHAARAASILASSVLARSYAT